MTSCKVSYSFKKKRQKVEKKNDKEVTQNKTSSFFCKKSRKKMTKDCQSQLFFKKEVKKSGKKMTNE